jgi:hypothetical protein
MEKGMTDRRNGDADANRPTDTPAAAGSGKREPANVEGQALVYGRNPPAADEDQNVRGSGMTDIGDVAQNQMPGTPQDLAIHPADPLDEVRRHEFDRTVQEYQRKHRPR